MITLIPSHNPVLIGHDESLRQIEASYASGRMHHAWLIAGIEGIGKTTLAYHMANLLLSAGQNQLGKLNMQHPTARLIASEAHPDLFILRRALDDKTGELKDGISVEDARKLAPFLHMTATHGIWRVAIIDEAHALNRFGQNAILKVIEEPPANCLVILTATTPGALLPTIRSRCRVLQLHPLNNNTLHTVLARCGAEIDDEATLNNLTTLSNGSVGFALKILQSDCLPLYEELNRLLGAMPTLDMAQLHALADRIGRKADADSFQVITTLLVERLRKEVHNLAVQPTAGNRLDRSLQLWDKVGQIFAQADHANLDRKLAFISAVTEFRRAAA